MNYIEYALKNKEKFDEYIHWISTKKTATEKERVMKNKIKHKKAPKISDREAKIIRTMRNEWEEWESIMRKTWRSKSWVTKAFERYESLFW